MSLPETIEHNCSTCADEVPGCGHKRRNTEGHCVDWKDPRTFQGEQTK